MLRPATTADIPALESLIDLSVRVLQAGDYAPHQIESAIEGVFGVDTRLIADGTYFLVEAATPAGTLELAACGGWSKRRTLYGADRGPSREDTLLDPVHDLARIRAFFVHPAWVRRGIGTMLLDACERAAIAAGFQGFELGATLTGERLFRVRGYTPIERIEVPLANGATLPVIRMWKRLASTQPNVT
jgi:GNAT superfamily N-acetyltransferase